eukprot:14821582-Alexandrium_andersonii.AAC.1
MPSAQAAVATEDATHAEAAPSETHSGSSSSDELDRHSTYLSLTASRVDAEARRLYGSDVPPQQPAEEAPVTPSTAVSPGSGAAPTAPNPLTTGSATGSL